MTYTDLSSGGWNDVHWKPVEYLVAVFATSFAMCAIPFGIARGIQRMRNNQ